jgi:hypothetical protein
MTCAHKTFTAQVDVHRIVKEDDAKDVGYENAPVKTFVFEAQVKCAECGIPFSFLWDSLPKTQTIVPVTHDSMRMGPWTDPLRSTINAAIIPMPLELVHATNPTGTVQ